MAWTGSCSFPSLTLCVLSVELVLSLGTINSPGFPVNASRSCQRRSWHFLHAQTFIRSAGWLCSPAGKPLDVRLLDSRAHCCAGGHTVRQCTVHLGDQHVWDTQSLAHEVSQRKGFKQMDGFKQMPKPKIFLHAIVGNMCSFPMCSPSKSACLLLFSLKILVYWYWQISKWRKDKDTQAAQLPEVLWMGLMDPL